MLPYANDKPPSLQSPITFTQRGPNNSRSTLRQHVVMHPTPTDLGYRNRRQKRNTETGAQGSPVRGDSPRLPSPGKPFRDENPGVRAHYVNRDHANLPLATTDYERCRAGSIFGYETTAPKALAWTALRQVVVTGAAIDRWFK